MEIKDKIKSKRIELNMTLEELAIKTGVSKSTIKRWEDGEIASMKSSKIAALAKALNVEPSYLIYDNENQNIGVNNGIIGNNNQNNLIFNGRQLTPLENAILSICSTLTDDEKGNVLSYATKIFNNHLPGGDS